MPPDVFLALASSGLTLVASLMFFVSEERPQRELRLDADAELAFCLPPPRLASPPPLPPTVECRVLISAPDFRGVMTFRPSGEEWLVSFESAPLCDAPAVQVRGDEEVGGAVHDLRWHGRAGVVRPTRRSWKQKPGAA